jgi:polyhydroxyalkanoate synthesis regulator phasin
MPQPKSKPASSRSRKRRAKEAPPGGLAAVRELLARGVMLSTERMQEALDDAVRRGRMTRGDAEELLAALVTLGRRQTEELLADLEGLLGRSRDRTTDRVRRQVRRATGTTSGLPIGGYDDLTAAQITARLEGLDPPELRAVRDYERKHGNRKTVLSAVERRLG